jgi:transposase InsO family protein
MPWKQVRVSEQRMRFAIEASKPGSCMAALCREFGVSRQTGYLWLKRYRQAGAAAVLTEQSRRPHKSPGQAPQQVVDALKAARLERPDWGVRKLAYVLRSKHPELPTVATSTLQRILEREGLIADRDRQQIAVQRFERKQPNELWQMDFKGPQGFNNGCGPLSIQDDFSRYLLALQHLPTNNTENVKNTLLTAFESCGLPEYMLLDHGKPWYDSINLWGWTELTIWIMRQGIRLTFTRIRHPQTQGKIERMHEALQWAICKRKPPDAEQQDWLNSFRNEYNHVRPHEGIGMVTPATRWQPSPRKFNPNPGEWDYPSDWKVLRLGVDGQFWLKGKRWDVSRSLRGQLVALQSNGPRLLVYYCSMAVREINLETAINRALPGNPFRLLHC